jgi:hypothetical protein
VQEEVDFQEVVHHRVELRVVEVDLVVRGSKKLIEFHKPCKFLHNEIYQCVLRSELLQVGRSLELFFGLYYSIHLP